MSPCAVRTAVTIAACCLASTSRAAVATYRAEGFIVTVDPGADVHFSPSERFTVVFTWDDAVAPSISQPSLTLYQGAVTDIHLNAEFGSRATALSSLATTWAVGLWDYLTVQTHISAPYFGLTSNFGIVSGPAFDGLSDDLSLRILAFTFLDDDSEYYDSTPPQFSLPDPDVFDEINMYIWWLGAPNSNREAEVWGHVTSFTLVPEPTTMALATLSVLYWLPSLSRRRPSLPAQP